MPEFIAVCCCQCRTFQVQQIKKVEKFACTLCGQRQSVKLVYATNPAAREVRIVVQRLNSERATAQDAPQQRCFAKGASQRPEGSGKLTGSRQPTDWKQFLPQQPLGFSQENAAAACTAEDSSYVTCLPEASAKRSAKQPKGQQSKGGQPCSRPPHCSTVTSSALNGQPMLRPARGHATSSFQPVDNQSLKRHRLSGAPAAPSCSPRPGQPTPVWHGMSRAHSPPHKNSGPKRPPGQPAQPNSSRWAEYTAHAEPELTSTNELAAKTVKHAWGQQCSGQVDSEVVLLVTSLD